MKLYLFMSWLLNFFDFKDDSSVWKFMVDGRPKCKKSEVCLGIIPMSFNNNVQSCNMVFPIVIFPGNEGTEEFDTNLQDVMQVIMDTQEQGLKVGDSVHKIAYETEICDQFMQIIAAGVKDGPCQIKLEEVMKDLGLPFGYYDRKKGPGWRLPSYSGRQASIIMSHVDDIAGCWPKYDINTIKSY